MSARCVVRYGDAFSISISISILLFIHNIVALKPNYMCLQY